MGRVFHTAAGLYVVDTMLLILHLILLLLRPGVKRLIRGGQEKVTSTILISSLTPIARAPHMGFRESFPL